ncbi:medium-chain fatty acid-CoA ligase faa2 [Dimargaris xerosporica]|nr:medium-chain fatty acid-CoA ligase faa2 [Dimargaris xerosporica]
MVCTWTLGLETLRLFRNAAVKTYPKLPYLGHRPVDPQTGARANYYVWQTYEQVGQRTNNLGAGLMKLWKEHTPQTYPEGLDQISLGIYAPNRPEWVVTEMAGFCYRMFSVALYDTLGPQTVEFVINHSEISVLVCSVDKIPALLRLADKIPVLKVIVSMDSLDESVAPLRPGLSVSSVNVLKQWAADKGVHLYDLYEVEQLGVTNVTAHMPPGPEDLCTVCYTSGTTGDPKGALLTHRNYTAAAWGAQASGLTSFQGQQHPPEDLVTISYLPLAHCYERACEYQNLAAGGSIGFFSGSLDLLMEDIALLKPTVFPSVPRLLNRIYDRIVASTINAPGLTGMLARRAVADKLANLRAGNGYTHAFWDRVLFNKIRKVLGGNLKLVVSGSAPIEPEILDFLRIAFCCEVREGYGQTETAAITSITRENDHKSGHVGVAFSSLEIRLVDVPEMSYYATDKQGPRGEVCLRGENVFKGYYKAPEKTREVLDSDGWLSSGDIGMILPNGSLKIIDRKKNIFKLAQGEYIAPEKIENVYTQHMLVEQMYVHGDSLQSQLVGVVVPDAEAFIPWAAAVLGEPAPRGASSPANAAVADLDRHPKVRAALLRELHKVGKRSGLHSFEQVKAIYIESEPFSIDNGLLTPTLKLKRQEAIKVYGDRIAALYAELSQQAAPRAKL